MTENHADGDAATVLIVDDEQKLADLYARWLSDRYDVKTAYDGEEALATLDDTIDVVLLDRRMPNLHGDGVMEHIRAQDYQVRVAIVSAVNPDFDVIGMGFDEYLVKPVKFGELEDAVDRLLNLNEYERTSQELSQLLATKAVLEAEKETATLRDNEQYQELQRDIMALQEDVDETLREFTDDDYLAAFRDIEANDN